MKAGRSRRLQVLAVAVALGAILVVLVAQGAFAGAGAAPAQSVLVVNTSADAVPTSIVGTAAVAVQERPFQVIFRGFSVDSNACQDVALDAGKPFALEAVAVRPTTANVPQNVALRVTQRFSAGGTLFYTLYSFHLDSAGFADKLLQLHVRPNANADAADGDIIGLSFCWDNPFSPFNTGVHAVLSGHYE